MPSRPSPSSTILMHIGYIAIEAIARIDNVSFKANPRLREFTDFQIRVKKQPSLAISKVHSL